MQYKLFTALIPPLNKSNLVDKEQLKYLIKDIVHQGSDGILIRYNENISFDIVLTILKIINDTLQGEVIIDIYNSENLKIMDIAKSILL